ncbi:MAG: Fic family protein [Nitrospirae bacterium]|nr:Fic family protein [Nitrospirota bacterium]
MNPKDFERSPAGRCVRTLRDYCAFVPNPLPPIIEYDDRLIRLLSDADRLLGELSGIGRLLKNPFLLISPYIRREAVSSSKIEGTQSSLSDLFFYEASEMKIPKILDVKEVYNYVQSMIQGIALLEKLPISTRLICELHKILMKGVRGEHGTPGELRRSQNWIGPPGCTLNEATFIPPPVEEMNASLSDWEKYINSEPKEPILIQASLLHYQFEAIHPFIDGNGRIGRLLITLFLCQKGSLSQPLLYLSEFFEKYRDDYYARLLAASKTGDWKGWIEFFLRGVVNMANDALDNAKKILALHDEYSQRINKARRVPEIVHKLLDEIFTSPVVSISVLTRKWDASFNSLKGGVIKLQDLGILKEVTGKRRNKLFASQALLDILIKK